MKNLAMIDEWRWLVNPAMGGVATTLKTSNHCSGSITHPKGGRDEMGILEYDKNSSDK